MNKQLLQKAKDIVAQKHEYADWCQTENTEDDSDPIQVTMLEDVAEQYANIRCAPLVEALREMLNTGWAVGVSESKWGDTEYDSKSAAVGYNDCLAEMQKRASTALSQYNAGEVVKEKSSSGYSDPWISVEDRLPEVGQMVLVSIESDTILTGRLMNNGWTALFLDGEHLVSERKVTHWMPLPAPPVTKQ